MIQVEGLFRSIHTTYLISLAHNYFKISFFEREEESDRDLSSIPKWQQCSALSQASSQKLQLAFPMWVSEARHLSYLPVIS